MGFELVWILGLHRRFIIQRGHEHTRTGNWSESGTILLLPIMYGVRHTKGWLGGGFVYCPTAVQEYGNSGSNAGGPKEWKDDRFVHIRLEVKQYLVKAKWIHQKQTSDEADHLPTYLGHRAGLHSFVHTNNIYIYIYIYIYMYIFVYICICIYMYVYINK